MAPPETDTGAGSQHKLVSGAVGVLSVIGERAFAVLAHVGDLVLLFGSAMGWFLRGFRSQKVRKGNSALVFQIVRVGFRSIFIVGLVSGCVGLILALQLAPPLDGFGQRELIANIVGVAVLRELGPLIGAIVLTGFAGASIAAEIGTMVVSEEVEALEAHALNPVRFLVVPRVFATILSMSALGVIASTVSILAAMAVSITILDIPLTSYIRNTLLQAKLVDFLTGTMKSTVFGALIGLIACGNGLKVTGGAAGVGNATTGTVVQSVVAIVIADLVFTAIFYALKLV